MRRSGHPGQTLVEFSLVMIAFITLALGVVDFGRGILYYNMLSNAAREGAGHGIIAGRSSDSVCRAALAAAQLPVAPGLTTCGTTSDGDLTVSASPDPTASGGTVAVSLSFNFRPITPIVDSLVGGPLTLTASSTMDVE